MTLKCLFFTFSANLNLNKSMKNHKYINKDRSETTIALDDTAGHPGFTCIIHCYKMWRISPMPHGLFVASFSNLKASCKI